MAPTLTSRLQLSKPDPNDFVNVLVDLDGNYDKIDLLDKKPSPITQPFIKRNTADAVSSATDSVFETLTVDLKTNHWYEVRSEFRMNTSVAVGVNPNGVASIRFKAGVSVANTDTQLARRGVSNNTTTSYGVSIGQVFDVPASGSYTFGLSVNSGGANTLNILASGGADNTGIDRCFWVRDMGEK